MNWATGFLKKKKKKKSNLHPRLKHLSVSTMPTFKTARDTVVLQSGFRGDESYRSSPRDAGVQPPEPQPLQSPALSSHHRGPTGVGLTGGLASLSLPRRKACQASARHAKLPVPEPATRAAREPPTEGTLAPTPPPSLRLPPGKASGAAVPARRSPRPPSVPLGSRPRRLRVAPSP